MYFFFPFIEENSNTAKPQSSTVNDLFSELHLSEIHKLEKQLENVR